MTDKEIAKSNVTIRDVLSKYGVHIYRGDWIICPCHNDTKPSMKIYNNNRCHCFVCNASLDIIDFVMHEENCNYRQALNRISEMFGLGFSDDLTIEQKIELAQKLRERNDKRRRLARIEHDSKLWLDIIAKELGRQSEIAKRCLPYNVNKLDGYIEYTPFCGMLVNAEREIERLEWLYDAIACFVGKECEFDYTLYGQYVCDKDDMQKRKLYILNELKYHRIGVGNGKRNY